MAPVISYRHTAALCTILNIIQCTPPLASPLLVPAGFFFSTPKIFFFQLFFKRFLRKFLYVVYIYLPVFVQVLVYRFQLQYFCYVYLSPVFFIATPPGSAGGYNSRGIVGCSSAGSTATMTNSSTNSGVTLNTCGGSIGGSREYGLDGPAEDPSAVSVWSCRVGAGNVALLVCGTLYYTIHARFLGTP